MMGGNLKTAILTICLVLCLAGYLYLTNNNITSTSEVLSEIKTDDKDTSSAKINHQISSEHKDKSKKNDRNSELRCSDVEQKKRFPSGILIGDKKAGTRAIIDFLTLLNPSIRQPPGGEVHFFDRDASYKRGLEHYLSFMPVSCPGDVTIEKSPSYLRISSVPRRVYRWNKEARIVVSLRDPISRAVSDYAMYTRQLTKKQSKNHHFHNLSSFEDKALLPSGDVNSRFSPLVISSHSHLYMTRWLQDFPPEQILVLDANALIKNNPAEIMRTVETHLGLDPQITEDMFELNDRGFYTMVNATVKEKGHSQTKLKDSTKETLRMFFRPSVRKLYKVLGRKLSWMDYYLQDEQ